MNKLIIIGSIALVVGCVSKPIVQGAEKIFVSDASPPAGCRFVGEVQGSQGNFWTAQFTSDRNILTGARNEMRNQALSLGANYVVVETESNSHNTSHDALGGTFASVVFGNAYKCPAE
jgi:hypothetical protein